MMKHDYQAALDRIKRNIEPCDARTEEDREHFMTIMDALELAASVVVDLSDVVRVVRCRDCKHWAVLEECGHYCSYWGNMMTDTLEDDFCSNGERGEP